MKLQPEIMRDLITKYDVLSVRGRRYPRIKTEGKTMDVYHEYGMVPFQHRKDLDITLQILKENIRRLHRQQIRICSPKPPMSAICSS